MLVSYRLFPSMGVSVASCERSFEIEAHQDVLRMGQECLSSLALLSTERELINVVDFDSVIAEFASLKARKIRL